jgi:hypothetical protein
VISGEYLIADTAVTDNRTGIVAELANVTLDHVLLFRNSAGLANSHANATVADTTAIANQTGFLVSFGASFAHSTIENNTNLGEEWLAPQASATTTSKATAPTLRAAPSSTSARNKPGRLAGLLPFGPPLSTLEPITPPAAAFLTAY